MPDRPPLFAIEWLQRNFHLVAIKQSHPLPPRLSIDTRHAAVADKALTAGANLINDVSGLDSPEMRAVARSCDCDWVVMHHLGLPTELYDPTQYYDEVRQKWIGFGEDYSGTNPLNFESDIRDVGDE